MLSTKMKANQKDPRLNMPKPPKFLQGNNTKLE
jgi:hypothetical protein